jgi:hypothetical protein
MGWVISAPIIDTLKKPVTAPKISAATKLNKLLLIPLLISLGFFIFYSGEVLESFDRLVRAVKPNVGLIAVITAAVIFQLTGHALRARKTMLLLKKTKESTVRFQFRALSVGYLFNSVLPFRLGELIRARIIASGMGISFSYAFTVILFERAIDALFLGIAGLVAINIIANSNAAPIFVHALTLTIIGFAILALIILLIRQNRQVLTRWRHITSWLNDDLKVSYRFKLWSIIYGLQLSLVKPVLKPYLLLTVASWISYLLSALIVVWYFFPVLSAGAKTLLSLGPFYGVSRPAGPANLGSYSNILDQFTTGFALLVDQTLAFNLVMWGVMVIPISALGIALLLGRTRETLWRTPSRRISRNSLVNKLYRQEDISREMSNFLDNFFAGNSLSSIVHRLERSEQFRLLKYFKGGSDAITILALEDGQEVVKKIIPLEFEDRLKAQADWLRRYQRIDGIVDVLREERADDFYAIDLAYDPQNQEFYEFIHQRPLARSKEVLDKVYAKLARSVHKRPARLKAYPKDRDTYIKKHILGCLEQAASVNKTLVKAAAPDTIIINGKTYDNLYQILKKIKRNKQAWDEIARYQKTEQVHGDVIVDNLLVHKQTGDPLIIDPAPDGNIMNGPAFEFGKAMQSLRYGYETLLRDVDPVHLRGGNRIDFRDLSSNRYSKLSQYVRGEIMPKYLSEGERRVTLFHAGALYIRRLKHQVHYTPANTLKFYAVGVRALNDFLAQYEPEEQTPIRRRARTARK